MRRESVGDRLRKLRRERALTQPALAKRSGISLTMISRVETGGRSPSLETMAQLARGLDASPVYLVTGDEHAPCPFCGVRQ